ncbi:MAG TPA: hypothetical protein VGD76_04640 [Ramlibacter sp.]
MSTPVEVEPPKSGKPPPPKSRLEKLRGERGQGFEPRLPALHAGEDLLEWFWDVGPANAGAALTHTEIRNWQENTGFELQSWQARLLRRLSQEYLAETSRAADPMCPAPCPLEDFAPDRASVAETLRQRLRGMAES